MNDHSWPEDPEFQLARPGSHFLAAPESQGKRAWESEEWTHASLAKRKQQMSTALLYSFIRHFLGFSCIPRTVYMSNSVSVWLGMGQGAQQEGRNSKVKNLIHFLKREMSVGSKNWETRTLWLTCWYRW